ncbi:hypothetical protein HIM_05840 [Hirsutella minnesotensis 3608]|uniref:DUF2241 domain-containing protein n=1 Tax=Hirsutella minnesotensis 3608 TaxID=1043627 RepID=A0A0F7ZUE5_9HYPO|nr:hypothetical protein HIM_05840 [Hirsutella minnesotensis 3608]
MDAKTHSDSGETCLSKLLRNMTPSLDPATHVFATLPATANLPPLSEVRMLFREAEGVTVIVGLEYATAHDMDYSFPCKMITLNVNSSLEAVGFMAAIASRLAARGMGVNPVSGFYHDHLFVPLGREAEAMEVLTSLASETA